MSVVKNMNNNNLKFNKELASKIFWLTLTVGIIRGTILYYQYENHAQVCEIEIDDNNIFVDEDGQIKCYFYAGEHIITISRNDAYYYRSEEIEGYSIKEVEINGWRDNNKITYVNIVPVIAIATKNEDGQLEFSDFGIVLSEKDIQKKLRK